MNSFNNPLFQNQFNNQNVNQGYNRNSNFAVWTPHTFRTNINSNGYAQGETTSQGFSPVVIQPSGMPAISTLNAGSQLLQSTQICSIFNNGYTAPMEPF